MEPGPGSTWRCCWVSAVPCGSLAERCSRDGTCARFDGQSCAPLASLARLREEPFVHFGIVADLSADAVACTWKLGVFRWRLHFLQRLRDRAAAFGRHDVVFFAMENPERNSPQVARDGNVRAARH